MTDAFSDAWRALLQFEHLTAWLVGLWLLYVLWVGGWIILQKREPAATISWLLGLALLPYLGFIVYYFFGPQRIRRQRLRRERSRLSLPDARDGPDAECRELAQLGRATTGLAPSSATDVRLLSSGEEKYEALLADIAAAGRYIHLEYYIWQPDRIGTRLRDALVERARAGVDVRLLLDAVGAVKCDDAFFQPLVDAGGELAWFHPVRLLKFWKRPWVNLRNHRKIAVIDGAVAFTGGMNIADEQDGRVDPSAYRDLHLRLTGDVVSVLGTVFMDDWAYATGRVPSVPSADARGPGEVPAQVLTSGPDSPWEAIHRLHVGAIYAARKRVWLVTPYFVPGEAGMMALTSAALGGLDVRLVIPKMSDSRVVTYATRSYFDELLAAGVKLYEYGPRLMHCKALLVDDDLALIGSANFDHRSFRLNFEVQVLFRDAGIAAALARLVEHDLAHAPRVKAERHRPLFRDRLPEALARLVSPLL
ncbi:MAG TPA: cardiolipin synthase [Xanthomonadaceae bacterium]|nr:cardiolipin synthase [Xanthomonadaceae bacterium]